MKFSDILNIFKGKGKTAERKLPLAEDVHPKSVYKPGETKSDDLPAEGDEDEGPIIYRRIGATTVELEKPISAREIERQAPKPVAVEIPKTTIVEKPAAAPKPVAAEKPVIVEKPVAVETPKPAPAEVTTATEPKSAVPNSVFLAAVEAASAHVEREPVPAKNKGGRPRRKDDGGKFVSDVEALIKKNISNADLDVELIADAMGISRVHLNRRLNEAVGKPVTTLIKEARMKKAALMLMSGYPRNIQDVSKSAGFSTHAYFTKSFSDFFGMTPKVFAQQYKGREESEIDSFFS